MNKEGWIDIPCIINGTKIVLTTAKDITSEDIENTLYFLFAIGEETTHHGSGEKREGKN